MNNINKQTYTCIHMCFPSSTRKLKKVATVVSFINFVDLWTIFGVIFFKFHLTVFLLLFILRIVLLFWNEKNKLRCPLPPPKKKSPHKTPPPKKNPVHEQGKTTKKHTRVHSFQNLVFDLQCVFHTLTIFGIYKSTCTRILSFKSHQWEKNRIT